MVDNEGIKFVNQVQLGVTSLMKAIYIPGFSL